MNLHDVIRELIDVAAGTIAHLPPARAAELHAAVDDSEASTAAAVDGPDVAPEPGGAPAPAPAGEPVAG